MKTIYTFYSSLLFLTSISNLSAQCVKSCCQSEALYAFADFAKEEEFRAGHDSPQPFHYESTDGTMIIFKTPYGATGRAFEIKAAKPTKNYLIVIQEWWGLNDYIKREAEKLQKDLGNVNVYAIDMYDGKLATNRDSAGKYMGEFKQERGVALIKGLLTSFGAGAKVGSIGWCFGGGWSLQTALISGKSAVACVMYYGMPEENTDKLKTLNTDVLGIFAKEDKWISPEVVGKFEKNMAAAGEKVTVKIYNADHAFANPSNPKYSKEMGDDAYNASVVYLKKRFK